MTRSVFPVLLLLSSCARSDPRRNLVEMKARATRLAAVATTDGIDRAEASAIAEAYFVMDVGWGCGAVGDPVRETGGWRFPLLFGVSAKPNGSVLVDSVSGGAGRFPNVVALSKAMQDLATP